MEEEGDDGRGIKDGDKGAAEEEEAINTIEHLTSSMYTGWHGGLAS